MTIEEKAKAYDEALERARIEYKNEQSKGNIWDCESLSTIFPGLKESEDEKIKRWIVKQIKTYDPSNIRDKALAWLEKQADKEEPQVYETEDGEIITYSESEGYKVIKPKFHEGDWVVDKQGIVHQIANVVENVTNHTYGYAIVGGGYFNDNNEGVRLWTIQDAKDGDVLVGNKEWDVILIFRGIGNTEWDDVIDYHCCYDYYRKDFNVQKGLEYWGNIKNNQLKPATKEQRDTLMKAMADARYTFDFEKKKLRKIEPIDEYEGLTDFERTLADICIGWIGKEIGWKEYIKDNADVLLKIAVKKFNLVQDVPFEQKTAWSEEDESYLNTTIAYLKDAKEFKKTADNCINWLKSLKDRYTWKPSDGQMRVLEELVEDNNQRYFYSILKSLYEQLKILK